MIGTRATHVRFGPGQITAFAPPRIEISFDSGEVKTFVYPQSAERFLTFEDEAFARQARLDLEQASVLARRSAEAKLLADRQRAEEAARRQLEAIREKKVAAARRTAARSAAARRLKAQRDADE